MMTANAEHISQQWEDGVVFSADPDDNEEGDGDAWDDRIILEVSNDFVDRYLGFNVLINRHFTNR